MDEYLEAMAEDMGKAQDALKREFAKVRTGRATPKLVDSVQVHVVSYGATMPLMELATIKAADARLLVVTPWDKSTIADVQKSIMAAGLGLNPSTDGKVIRIPVPPLSAERRQDLVKQVRKMGEDAKVRVRHVRRDYNDIFKSAESDGDISEDECRRLLAKVQERTDAEVKRVDEVVEAKEAELLEV